MLTMFIEKVFTRLFSRERNTVKKKAPLKVSAAKDSSVVLQDNLLDGADLALGVCGSIAAVEAIKLIRQLRRHGAKVTVYATKDALAFVSKRSLAWASEGEVVVDFGSEATHVFSHDLLLIAPATLNHLTKIANGLADDVITALCQSLLGFRNLNKEQKSKPQLLLAPCMHLSMAASPAYQRAFEMLSSLGVVFIPPVIEEDKCKLPPIDRLCDFVIREYKQFLDVARLDKKNIFITAGAVSVALDDVRLLTNRASGKTGYALARYAFYQGAKVHLLIHKDFFHSKDDAFAEFSYYRSYEEYKEILLDVLKKNKIDMAVFTAAVSDFHLQKVAKGKMDSKKNHQINLMPTDKIIDLACKRFPSLKVVAFKLDCFASEEEMKKNILEIFRKNSYHAVVGTDSGVFNAASSIFQKRVVAFKKDGKTTQAAVDDVQSLADVLFQLI